ncbi:hypothetical protein RJT34_31334 [Clitoria ternatea]|uniref:Bromo domain-containing protein n=1 Tax=Clitoria ternatea TaxID=43366 RepID=A0AAN9I193_CLITE
MEAKDGTRYKHDREIYADVRLVFKNAMKYNDERSDVHVMVKTLLAKFEEKWLQLLPKTTEEETRRDKEEAEAHLALQRAQEAAHAKMTRDLRNELSLTRSCTVTTNFSFGIISMGAATTSSSGMKAFCKMGITESAIHSMTSMNASYGSYSRSSYSIGMSIYSDTREGGRRTGTSYGCK